VKPGTRFHSRTLLWTLIVAAGCSGNTAGNGTGSGGVTGSGGAASGGAPGSGGVTGGGASSGGAPGATGSGGHATTGSGGAVTATGGAAHGGNASGGAPGSGGRSGGSSGGTAGRAGSSGGAPAGSGGTTGGGGAGPAGGASGADVIATIHNGGFWNDSGGKRIEAHGGGFIRVGDMFYWIGEDKSANSGNFKAVNCYASKDLTNWEFRNAIITKSTTTELAASGRIIERPKVVYNDTTKKYVMWLHWDGNSYAEAKAGVFTSDTIDGDYTYVSSFQPNGNMSRDDTLFKDDDGKAYFMSAANNNADLIIYQLSDDYLTIAKQVVTPWPGTSREAPAMFKANGRYYLITSAATGWDSNQAKYSSATSISGPWSSLMNVADSTTYDTQAAYVIPIVGSQTTTYIYAGDRWQDPDLVSSKYIWFPLKFNGTSLVMDRVDDWQLDITTGQWTSKVSNGFLPQTGWKLVFADSQETQDQDDHATNAFDGSPSTIWHTQYTGTTAPYPHEIQIDLGAATTFAGFGYLPRQDKDDHGIVKDYAFYVGQDTTNWGTPVAMGTFANDRSQKKVMFTAPQTARYIRFVALSEINGSAWASAAEINLIPMAGATP